MLFENNFLDYYTKTNKSKNRIGMSLEVASGYPWERLGDVRGRAHLLLGNTF